jgi:hypothetical protein
MLRGKKCALLYFDFFDPKIPFIINVLNPKSYKYKEEIRLVSPFFRELTTMA